MPKDIVQTILVVDDDASFRQLLKYVLKQQYHLLLAESAEHALTVLAEQRPDLIVLDVVLPGMSGLDLLRQIKTSWPDIPVLMLSATNQTPHGGGSHQIRRLRLPDETHYRGRIVH